MLLAVVLGTDKNTPEWKAFCEADAQGAQKIAEACGPLPDKVGAFIPFLCQHVPFHSSDPNNLHSHPIVFF
jgi:hypothetical protein